MPEEKKTIIIHHLDGSIEKDEVGEKGTYGVTAIGFYFTSLKTGIDTYIHLSQVKRIEVI